MKKYSLLAMKFLFALSLMGLAPHALAASFDCSNAVTTTEKLTCSDAETSALDSKLQKTYKTALTAVAPYSKSNLVEEQRRWITYTRNICLDTACLRQVYADRIAVLGHNAKYIGNDDSYCIKPSGYQGGAQNCGVSVEAYRDPNDRIDSFNQSLAEQKQSGRIIGCRRLIALGSGTHIGPGSGNQNFGGYCVFQDGTQRRSVVICNDDMIGNFQMQPAASQDVSDTHLIDFTYAQCFRG